MVGAAPDEGARGAKASREVLMRDSKRMVVGSESGPAWRPSRAKPAPLVNPASRWRLGRWFRRRAEPTLYQRCLAVHIHYATLQRTLT